jgi:hypothetical protein
MLRTILVQNDAPSLKYAPIWFSFCPACPDKAD